MSRILTTLLISLAVSSAPAVGQIEDDRAAIRETILDYVEGWWTGDVVRMQESLHPDLVKRVVYEHEATGRSMLSTMSKTDMVEHTRLGAAARTLSRKAKSKCRSLR